MSPAARSTFVFLGIVITISFAIFLVFRTPDKKDTNTADVKIATLESTPVEPDINLLLDAMLRRFPIDQVCFDSKNKVYFVDMAPHPHDDNWKDAGWWMIDKFTFLELSNGTWLLKDFDGFIDVEPDVTGLKCKQQAPNPNWFK